MADTGKRRQPRHGASSARVSLAGLGRSYLTHHGQVAAETLRRLRTTPLASLMTLLVMAIALSLPGILYVGLANLQALGSQWQGNAQISLYLEETLDEAAGRDLAAQLEANSQIATTHYLSATDAMNEFKQFSGLGEALNQLDSNPLPAVILANPSEAYRQQPAQETLRQLLASVDGIAQAQSDQVWVERLGAMVELAQRVTWLLAGLLGVAVVLVVGNTIRLEIEGRRDEILVIKLVGGTDAFVRRPFLYSGLCYGLFSGLLAWLLIQGGLWLLADPIGALTQLYDSGFAVTGFDVDALVVLLLLSGFMGTGGAWLAVVRHLKAIEPR